jgi:DnaJ-class molecular chaperone
MYWLASCDVCHGWGEIEYDLPRSLDTEWQICSRCGGDGEMVVSCPECGADMFVSDQNHNRCKDCR